MPDQIRRLLVVMVIIGVTFIVVRGFFIPDSFGEQGHYRNNAVDSIAAQGIKYAGNQACLDCHDDIASIKHDSFHKTVNCEACHGPSAEHIRSFDGDELILPVVPRDRDSCTLCHIYNPAKPTGFPQIDPVAHNPLKPCIVCHNPHAPDPPETPGECSACHTQIARTKALSPHALLNCQDCHLTPEEHRDTPRQVRPDKPTERDDCGICHSQEAEGDRFVPRIDLSDHGNGYLCWQCHYPHHPEAK